MTQAPPKATDGPHHGGALRAAQAAYRDAPTPWIDLSTGINPVPYSLGDVPAHAWTRLPEREDLAALEALAALAYSAADPASVVAAPGAQSLIQLLPRVVPARTVAILGPTYAEHAHCWRLGGADVRTSATLDAFMAGARDADVAVVVNPNNPDGRAVPIEVLRALAATLTARKGLLVIDESFADTAPATSFVPHLAGTPVVVLRSFGKFFGVAGVRLGFAVAPPALAARIRTMLGPWAVSGPAIAIGRAALADLAWQRATRDRLARDADRLDALLSGAGLPVIGGTTLFRLASHAQAARRHDMLCRAGILTRSFEDRPDRLRFGLPAPADWDRVAKALAAPP